MVIDPFVRVIALVSRIPRTFQPQSRYGFSDQRSDQRSLWAARSFAMSGNFAERSRK